MVGFWPYTITLHGAPLRPCHLFLPFSAFRLPQLHTSTSSKHPLAVRLQGTKHVPIMTSKTGDHESPQTLATSKATDLKASAQRVPPPETPEAIQTRFRVIAAFWAVIIFLGFPIWWKTTSIYRAHLPIQDMADWADGKVRRAWGRENECAFLRAQFLTLIVIDMSPGFPA
jgi:hypothetical protein